MINKLKKYLDDNDLEIEEVDLGDKTIDEIKSCLIDLGEYFLKYFNSFYKTFKNCKDKDVIAFIENNKIHFSEVLKLSNKYKEYNIEFGKSSIKRNLFIYLENHYFEINEFIDIVLEVQEE
ncbi:MAG: hypothetical protein KKF48_02615 [Nanoarchaeota archaeon]|nr:hypothetical protein [Nanoarchaeota archaeon]